MPRIPITDEAVNLAVRLSRISRPGDSDAARGVSEYVRFGAGPRGSQALVLAAKARAALRGEAAADVDDVRALVCRRSAIGSSSATAPTWTVSVTSRWCARSSNERADSESPMDQKTLKDAIKQLDDRRTGPAR